MPNRSAFAASCALDGAEGCFVDGGAVCPHAGFGGDPSVDGAGDLVDFACRQWFAEELLVHGLCGGLDCAAESVGVAEVVADFAVCPGAC